LKKHARQLKQTAKNIVTFFNDLTIQNDVLCRSLPSAGRAFRQRAYVFLPTFYQQFQIQHNDFVTLKEK